jgi:hypothetical protein
MNIQQNGAPDKQYNLKNSAFPSKQCFPLKTVLSLKNSAFHAYKMAHRTNSTIPKKQLSPQNVKRPPERFKNRALYSDRMICSLDT